MSDQANKFTGNRQPRVSVQRLREEVEKFTSQDLWDYFGEHQAYVIALSARNDAITAAFHEIDGLMRTLKELERRTLTAEEEHRHWVCTQWLQSFHDRELCRFRGDTPPPDPVLDQLEQSFSSDGSEEIHRPDVE